jgi:hypothetical protein
VGATIPFDYSSARAQGSGNLGQRAEGQVASFIPLEAGNAKAGHRISNKKVKKENCYRCAKPGHCFLTALLFCVTIASFPITSQRITLC